MHLFLFSLSFFSVAFLSLFSFTSTSANLNYYNLAWNFQSYYSYSRIIILLVLNFGNRKLLWKNDLWWLVNNILILIKSKILKNKEEKKLKSESVALYYVASMLFFYILFLFEMYLIYNKNFQRIYLLFLILNFLFNYFVVFNHFYKKK